jgi:hypothetical protein
MTAQGGSKLMRQWAPPRCAAKLRRRALQLHQQEQRLFSDCDANIITRLFYDSRIHHHENASPGAVHACIMGDT